MLRRMNLPCKKSDIEAIWWWDAISEWTRGQQDEVEKLQLAKNCNLGWVVHENTDRVIFCNGLSSSGELDHLVIPTPNIIERIKICPGRKRKSN